MATPATLRETRRGLSLVTGILPADQESSPSIAERLRFIPYVIVPWVLLYAVTAKLASHGISFGMPFEDRLPDPLLDRSHLSEYLRRYRAGALVGTNAKRSAQVNDLELARHGGRVSFLLAGSFQRSAASVAGPRLDYVFAGRRTHCLPSDCRLSIVSRAVGDLSWPGLPAPVDGLDLRRAHRGGLHHHRAALHRGCCMFGDDRTRFP